MSDDPCRLPEFDGFMRDILASPGDDLPRLVLADALEEKGYADRAAFIRVQCELAELSPVILDGRKNLWKAAEKHSRVLGLWKYEQEFLRVLRIASPAYLGFPHDTPNQTVYYRRGFVGHVRVDFATWYTGWDCIKCCGDGDYGGIDNRTCQACRGEGRLPGVGPKLCKEHPITSLTVLGKVPALLRLRRRAPRPDTAAGLPLERTEQDDRWHWYRNDDYAHLINDLPEKIFCRLTNDDADYPTRQDAIDDFNSACFAWAKGAK